MRKRPQSELAKRSFDLVVGGAAFVLLLPVMLVVAIVVAVALGRPVLFRQQRPGINGRPFTLLKFRTMLDSRNSDGTVMSDERRLTPFGQWLRSTSLDELPELWNVIRGEMSLVGPRPLLMQYLPLYSPVQARRHEVRPGITGWAQLNGRNAISWNDKLAMDVWYVDNRSFALDFRILVATLVAVLRRNGINAEGSATMPEFTGSAVSGDKDQL